jgi:hypothetical protein
MTEESPRKALLEELAEESNEPMTMKDRIIGLLIAIILGGLAVGMWLTPEFLSISTTSTSGRGARKIAWLLEIIWSRPLAVIIALLAIMAIWGALTKKSGEKPEQT